MKIYIVLEWGYDSDCRLVQMYAGAFSTHEAAEDFVGGTRYYDIDIKYNSRYCDLPDFSESSGHYKEPPFFHIIEEEI